MKMKKKQISILLIAALTTLLFAGCAQVETEENGDNVLSDNIIITETGEVLEKEPQPTEEVGEAVEGEAEAEATPDSTIPPVEVVEPEQVITEEDQIEPTGSELQIVFLGDSIFDTSRDGTGIPYLTAVQSEADVYNLAIAGTRATLQRDESPAREEWESLSLVQVVEALCGNISTDSFEGRRTKEILDNSNISWADTDYFVIEYGMNDFLSAAPLSNLDETFDLYTYTGALRYAVAKLSDLANDATIILCGPNYAQFYNSEGYMIGDGNTLNTGYGTLFDYKGTCEYVAKEQRVYFFDAYLDLGIDGYTAEEYLEDGVHLTAAGRQLYADELAKLILSIEETKNN